MEYHHGAVTEFVTQFSDEDMTNLDPEIWHCVQRVYDEVSMTLNPSPELEKVKHWEFFQHNATHLKLFSAQAEGFLKVVFLLGLFTYYFLYLIKSSLLSIMHSRTLPFSAQFQFNATTVLLGLSASKQIYTVEYYRIGSIQSCSVVLAKYCLFYLLHQPI